VTDQAIPPLLEKFAGRILDVDSHEQLPAQLWVETFGEVARPMAELMLGQQPSNPNHANVPDYEGDVKSIDPQTIWGMKGPKSAGAVDIRRRIGVLDMMAIDRQLLFPTSIGAWGMALYGAPEGTPLYQKFQERSRSYAESLFDAFNGWAVETARISPRVRPVTPVYGNSPEDLYNRVEGLIKQGVRAVTVMASALPGGESPAHQSHDRLYAMLSEAKVPLTLHIGGELLFVRTPRWSDAAAFEGYKFNEEITMDPWRLSMMHLAPQNFVATLVTGGVFHRHPKLRFGVMEYTAHWVGPLARLLDLWHDNNQSIGIKKFGMEYEGRKLPMRPSEYIQRNVRVAPFDFEPVDEYIEKFALEDVYCFATDYPHVEGGKDPMVRLGERLAPLGDHVLEKFFCTNAEWLLPV
jgi:predicted TIM-barrel fold metal-dependent hydrolase